jgi:hypothetical protein
VEDIDSVTDVELRDKDVILTEIQIWRTIDVVVETQSHDISKTV